jgi:cation:H+ antiporter
MPETILPFVAILVFGGDTGANIGVGAILGAPFMLATLAFLLVGITVLVGHARKKRAFEFKVEVGTMKRDLTFFICMYGASIFIPLIFDVAKYALAVALVIGYFYYAWLTFRGESGGILHVEDLYFSKWARTLKIRSKAKKGEVPELIFLIVVQVIFSLVIMVGGAHLFVGGLERVALAWGFSPLLFALLIAPIATELPEKFNSCTWTYKGKDTLAAGNITGAMVFQSTFPVSLGLLFTDWSLSGLAIFSAILALLSAIIILADITFRKKLSPITMMAVGIFYLVYVIAIILQH